MKRRLFNVGQDMVQDQKAPFAQMASFIHPHDPFVACAEWWDLYWNEDIDMLAFVPNKRIKTNFQSGLWTGYRRLKYPCAKRSCNALCAHNWLISVTLTVKFNEIVQTFDEISELENTIVIVTADHSNMQGGRGLWYK